MNERIRELAEQAGLKYYNWSTNESNIVDGNFRYPRLEDYKKFGQLIVRECVKVMYDNAIERRVPPDINQTPTHYAIAVLEHFGVKE